MSLDKRFDACCSAIQWFLLFFFFLFFLSKERKAISDAYFLNAIAVLFAIALISISGRRTRSRFLCWNRRGGGEKHFFPDHAVNTCNILSPATNCTNCSRLTDDYFIYSKSRRRLKIKPKFRMPSISWIDRHVLRHFYPLIPCPPTHHPSLIAQLVVIFSLTQSTTNLTNSRATASPKEEKNSVAKRHKFEQTGQREHRRSGRHLAAAGRIRAYSSRRNGPSLNNKTLARYKIITSTRCSLTNLECLQDNTKEKAYLPLTDDSCNFSFVM